MAKKMVHKDIVREIVGYVRVSSEEQKKSGLSMDGQETKIRAYILSQPGDLKIECVYKDDGVSAKDLNRPSMIQLIKRIEDGEISRVIVYKLDRITRSTSDLDYLLKFFEKHDVEFSSVSETLDTSTATGKMMVKFIGMFAEWERGMTIERTKQALSVKRSRGEKLGGIVPYGYKAINSQVVRMGKPVKVLIQDETEHPVVNGILDAHREGRGYADIAANLNKMGIPTRKGATWYASTVRAIVIRQQKEPVGTQEDTRSVDPNA